ncbi:hypothetical protein AOL_s00007g219 [Orbilia oligospora ATCC 24927]|uniref:F-box domain-containing protein n=1 Tax=Arthrobotrys oligospora (strain ATCC 24927 / CBS 115.81 / DSM 1491) TaxID=756982 RepID=G1X1R0_ARTOA|nr:hypothetical protein AOL_s00007g219 [Orbilia oligospora ATCC 24927]EGX52883.1 hypothetical protein AOL_s00007g219 [Orbilia oligospora ATCC 24927]
MATITALPTEVLLEVFELLDIESLTNAKTVCKQFRAVIRMIPLRSYTLRIDEPKHSMWKFTRFLLSDPKAGSQITDLTVEWCRREPDDPDTWTDKWEWTEKDLGIMKGLEETVIDKYLTPETYVAIKGGVNSEALLPLILCFTENLGSLDLGDVVTELFNCEGYPEDCLRKIFKSRSGGGGSDEGGKKKGEEEEEEGKEEGKEEKEQDGDNEEEDGDEFGQGGGVPTIILPHIPSEQFRTWFHLNTGYPGNYLPGLSRLKKFNHQLNGDALVAEYKWGWRADYFLPILFIPGIEEITIGGCATDEEVDGYTLKTIMGWYEEQFKGVPPSTVRKLVIRDARMYEKDYELIADYTCCLEKLHISYNDTFTELESYYDMADAIYVFFENNPKLRMDNLYVDGRPNEVWLKIFHDRDYDLLRGEDEYRERTYEEFVEEFEAWSQRRTLQDGAK